MSDDILALDLGVSCTTSYDADKFLVGAVDDYGGESSIPCEIKHIFGFVSRPLDPVVDGTGAVTNGCTMWTVGEGSRKYLIPLNDPRSVTPTSLQMGKGDSAMYCSGAGFFKLTGQGVNKNRVACGTQDTGGFDMGWQLDPGLGILGPGWSIFGQFGKQSFNMSGWHLLTQSGVQIDAGGIAGPGIGSAGAYFRVTSATLQLSAPAITLGPGAPTTHAVVAERLAGVLQLFAAALQAQATAITALTAASGTVVAGGANLPVASVGPVAAAETAVSTALTALTAAIAPPIPAYAAAGVLVS